MSEEHLQDDLPFQLSQEGCQELAIQVLKSCGYGRLLIIGLRDARLVQEFLQHGVDVTGLTASAEALPVIDAAVPGRVQGVDDTTALHLVQNGPFDTLILLLDSVLPGAWRADEDMPERLLRSARSVMLVLLGGQASHENAAGWDERFASAGARRHPLSCEVSGAGESAGKLLLLYESPSEGTSDETLSAREISDVQGFGNMAEARAARYQLAARFVRPGDRVLDVGSPSDAGAYLLSKATAASWVGRNTSSRIASRTNALFAAVGHSESEHQRDVGKLASGTADFIVIDNDSDESDSLWHEAKRVLTPGGRLYVCHPVVEGATEDAWNSIRARLESSGFLLERSWLQHNQMQTAGWVGHIQEMFPEDMTPVADDWLLLLAMKPITDYRPDVDRVDRVADSPNVIAFVRDYENPWLVRGLVAMGLRATSASLRITMADAVLVSASGNSADHGAALCVRCYAALEGESEASIQFEWMQRALAFAEASAPNPSVTRWQISLLFVAGLMAMRIGDLALAESAFARIRNFDALKFSPLLGTKTVGAALRCGIIAFARGDHDGARQEWTRAVLETQRLLREADWREVIVDIDRPETFGLPEIAAFVMDGGRAAGGLRALSDFPDKPSLVWQALHGTQADRVQEQDLELRSLHAWADELERAKNWLSQHSAKWEAEAASKNEQVRSLVDQYNQLEESRVWSEQQRVAWEEQARSLKELTRKFEQRIAAMQGEMHAVAKSSIEESRRLRSIESSRLFRLGRKLGLIRIKE